MTFKQFFIGFSLLVCSFSQAQKKDYKPFLELLFQHAQNDFKDIAGEEIDTSTFRDSKLKPEVGEIKISIMSYGANLNWTIPLEKSQSIQKDVEDFIKNKFSSNKNYLIAESDDLDNKNFTTKNVYLKSGQRKPKLVIQTFFFKDNNDAQKSNFSMIIYGK